MVELGWIYCDFVVVIVYDVGYDIGYLESFIFVCVGDFVDC